MKESILILLLFGIISCNPYVKNSVVRTEVYPDGKIKSSYQQTTIKSKKMELYDHYTRWDVVYVIYDKEGKVQSFSMQKYKSGTYGRPCREIISVYKEFYPSGKLKHIRKDQCDCKTSLVKEYNKKGKLLYSTRTHHKRYK